MLLFCSIKLSRLSPLLVLYHYYLLLFDKGGETFEVDNTAADLERHDSEQMALKTAERLLKVIFRAEILSRGKNIQNFFSNDIQELFSDNVADSYSDFGEFCYH